MYLKWIGRQGEAVIAHHDPKARFFLNGVKHRLRATLANKCLRDRPTIIVDIRLFLGVRFGSCTPNRKECTPMSLSDAKIRNAKPKVKPYKIADGDGLFLLITPAGGKYWRLKYYFGGKEKLLALGVYPSVTLADARARRDAASRLIAAGTDPSQAKQEAKRAVIQEQQNTFEAVAREWHTNRLVKWTPKYAKKMLRRLEMYVFPKLGPQPIAAISPQDMLSVMPHD